MSTKPDKRDTDTTRTGHDWNNPYTRRRFLARTGKAGAVTILALHGWKVEVLAETASGSANM